MYQDLIFLGYMCVGFAGLAGLALVFLLLAHVHNIFDKLDASKRMEVVHMINKQEPLFA